jgi:CRISPR-associated exonuclease Cas4
MIIPVEIKTGETPKEPYEGHILQLAAYCHLVEQAYRIRPEYGIIRYGTREFRIPYTLDLERDLERMVAEMRAKRAHGEIHRNHRRRGKCSACGFREVCSERLDTEYQTSFGW